MPGYKEISLPIGVYLGVLVTFATLGIGLFSLISMNKEMEKYYATVTFTRELESNIEENIERLRNSVKLAYYTGHISWETQYYSSHDQLVKQGSHWDQLMGSENKLYGYFLASEHQLMALDENIFEMVRQGKKALTIQALGSLEREKLFVKVERSYAALKDQIEFFLGEKRESIFKTMHDLYILSSIIIVLFMIGAVAAIKGLRFWMILQKLKTNELALQVKVTSRELEEEKQRSLKNQKMIELGVMAGGIGHEISSPISSALGYVEMVEIGLEKVPGIPQNINTNLKQAKKSMERIVKIVKGLRSFAREGENDNFESVTLHEVWEDISELSSSKFRQGSVALKSVGFLEGRTIQCRPVQVEQILLNLLNNAYDAVENSSHPWVEVSVDEKEKTYLFKVTDSGLGIPKDIVPAIFDPFYTTKPLGKGTGLGLAIIQKIIESHQGKFWVNSDHPRTQFCFELPKVQVSSQFEGLQVKVA